jgi:hypothetical protein
MYCWKVRGYELPETRHWCKSSSLGRRHRKPSRAGFAPRGRPSDAACGRRCAAAGAQPQRWDRSWLTFASAIDDPGRFKPRRGIVRSRPRPRCATVALRPSLTAAPYHASARAGLTQERRFQDPGLIKNSSVLGADIRGNLRQKWLAHRRGCYTQFNMVVTHHRRRHLPTGYPFMLPTSRSPLRPA